MINKIGIGDKVKVALENKNVVGNGEIGEVTSIQLMNNEIYYTLRLDNGFDSPIKEPGTCLPISCIQVKEGQYESLFPITNSINHKGKRSISPEDLEDAIIENGGKVKYLIVAVQLPTGAIEVINNFEDIAQKVDYYMSAYNENFELKANPKVKIVDFMII